MIFSTFPGMLALDGFGIRAEFRINCAILADMAIRGCAISFFVSARVVISSLVCFLLLKVVQYGIERKAFQSRFAQLQPFSTAGLITDASLMRPIGNFPLFVEQPGLGLRRRGGGLAAGNAHHAEHGQFGNGGAGNIDAIRVGIEIWRR